jgi:transcriptional regulator with XRE-family HTH domain
MRLPTGYAELRKDLGTYLRKCRTEPEMGEALTQAEVAALASISREGLSRIENGRQWPSFATLYRLMGLFSLDWHQVAIEGKGIRPSHHYAPDPLQDLGAELRAGRLAEGLSLQDLGKRVGLSGAQLSRIERAQCTRSKVIAVERFGPEDDDLVFRFSHPELCRLAERGGRELRGDPEHQGAQGTGAASYSYSDLW